MISFLKRCLWKNFGASIDMLKNAILLCSEEHWTANKKFFYNAYHALIFLDFYLTIPPKDFSSQLPFKLVGSGDIPEDAIDDVVPDRIYSKKELLDYLQLSREKCRIVIAGLTEEKLKQRWIDGAGPMDLALSGQDALNYSVLEILFYNMRHVQHHAAQLNLLLRLRINKAPDYVSQVEDELWLNK
jgi:hypothetical protein